MIVKDHQQVQPESDLQLKVQIGLIFLAFILLGANVSAVGVLIPSLSAYYHIDNSIIGLLFITSMVGDILAAFCSGPLLYRLGRQKFLILGTAIFLLGAFLLSLRPLFVVLLTLRVLLHFGIALINTGANASLAVLPRNTSLLNYLHAFFGIGGLLGPVVAGLYISTPSSWNGVYILWALLSALLLVGFWLQLRSPHRTDADEVHLQHSQKTILVHVLKSPVIWLTIFFLLFYIGLESSIGNWIYSFLVDAQHQEGVSASWAVSGFWIGLTLSRLVIAPTTGRLKVNKISLLFLCLVGATLGVLFVWLGHIAAVSAIGLWMIGFSLGPIFPTIIALVPDLVPSYLLSNTMGALINLSVFGAAFFPWLCGNLAQFAGFGSLLPYLLTLVVIMFCFWLCLYVITQRRLGSLEKAG